MLVALPEELFAKPDQHCGVAVPGERLLDLLGANAWGTEQSAFFALPCKTPVQRGVATIHKRRYLL